MGLFNRKHQVPAEGLAAHLAKAVATDALFGESSLDRNISSVDSSFNERNTRYVAELLAACYLAYDMIMQTELGRHADRVASITRRFLLDALNEQREAIGERPLEQDQWDSLLHERCSEYAASLGGGMSKEGLMRFGSLAAKRISGTGEADLRIAMPVVILFSGALKHMGPAIAGYEITD